jgi:hypothetical protein
MTRKKDTQKEKKRGTIVNLENQNLKRRRESVKFSEN